MGFNSGFKGLTLIPFKPGLHNFVIKLDPLTTKKEEIITSLGK